MIFKPLRATGKGSVNKCHLKSKDLEHNDEHSALNTTDASHISS